MSKSVSLKRTATQHGLGKHINTLRPSQLLHEDQASPVLHDPVYAYARKAYFASELIWSIAIPLIKISILLLYLRIIARLRYVRNLCYGIGVFTICWAIMIFLIISFQCRPKQFI